MKQKYSDRVGVGGNTGLKEIPAWPLECSVSGCHGDTASIMITVKDPNEPRPITRLFSMVGIIKGFGDKQKLHLRGNYTFVRWVTRCQECYMAEAIATKKQQMNVESSDKLFIDNHRSRLRD